MWSGVQARMKRRKHKNTLTDDFIRAFISYSKGESVEGFRVFKYNKEGKKIEVIDNLELIYE